MHRAVNEIGDSMVNTDPNLIKLHLIIKNDVRRVYGLLLLFSNGNVPIMSGSKTPWQRHDPEHD